MNWEEFINSKGKRTWEAYGKSGQLMRIVQDAEETFTGSVFHAKISDGTIGQCSAQSFDLAAEACTKILYGQRGSHG
jgi:hypothetical protein